MSRAGGIFLLAACAAVLWWLFQRGSEGPSEATVRLSSFIDSQIDRILSPLSSDVAPLPRQELREVRELFIDGAKNDSNGETMAHRLGVGLCDQLSRAMDSRERHILSLADSRAKAGSSQRFFDNQVNHRWAEECAVRRLSIDRAYQALRDAERGSWFPRWQTRRDAPSFPNSRPSVDTGQRN